jgi:hypothetical protein
MTMEKARWLLNTALVKLPGPAVSEAGPVEDEEVREESGQPRESDEVAPVREEPEEPGEPEKGSPDPERLTPSLNVMLASARADEAMEIQRFLYWKDR